MVTTVTTSADQVKQQVGTLSGTRGAQVLRGVKPLSSSLLAQLQVRARGARLLRRVRVDVGDDPLLNRLALHLVVVLLAVGVVAISQFSLPEVDFLLPTPTLGSIVVKG